MPVDIHPEHKITGVELILTRLHSGGKFTNEIIISLAVSMVLVFRLLTPLGELRSGDKREERFFDKAMPLDRLFLN